MKTCSKCKTPKPETEFHRAAHHKDGLVYWCKLCRSSEDRQRRKILPEFREREREHQRAKNYGLAHGEYDRMLKEQGGVCAICKEPEMLPGRDSLSVDHDHEAGSVRGLLCRRCNAGIGSLQEDEKILLSAIQYLRGNQTKPTVLQYMKKTLNKFLKFLGFNVVKAKRARARKPAYRSHVQIEDANTGRTHYVGDDCPGGHLDLECPRVEQPKSDNGVKGPTS